MCNYYLSRYIRKSNNLTMYYLNYVLYSTPVRGQFKEARWVLRKIIPGVIKNTPSGFGVRQLAFIKGFC